MSRQRKGIKTMTTELRQSLRATRAAIENAINNDRFSGRTPKDTANTILNDMDFDVARWLLADAVKSADWDGRYSRTTRTWASQLYIPMLDGASNEYNRIQTHPALVNQVIEALIS
jgi:hypothetical protein